MNATLKKNPIFSENACISSGDYSINHLDHLSVIAFIMDAPLINDTKLLHQAIQKYYPQVKPLYIHFRQQIPEYLALHYKRVFFSLAPYRRDLSPILEGFYKKKIEFWYCPHGNSDKTLEHYAMQHHALIYGDQMERRLINEGYIHHLKSYIKTGNIRVPFYYQHKDFYDDLVEKEVFSQFSKKQTTYLYAPTWHDFELSSSLFEISIPLIEQLPDHINLIVKMHPWLEHHHPNHVHLIQARYQEKPNVVILSQYPLVIPILERSDLYLGDFSSIGYDFLRYNRPMFFFHSEKRISKRKNDSLLHTCGKIIPSQNYGNIFSFVETHIKKQELFSQKRQALYQDAFGNFPSFSSHFRSNNS